MTMRVTVQQVQPNLSRLSVSTIVRTFRQHNRYSNCVLGLWLFTVCKHFSTIHFSNSKTIGEQPVSPLYWSWVHYGIIFTVLYVYVIPSVLFVELQDCLKEVAGVPCLRYSKRLTLLLWFFKIMTSVLEKYETKQSKMIQVFEVSILWPSLLLIISCRGTGSTWRKCTRYPLSEILEDWKSYAFCMCK